MATDHKIRVQILGGRPMRFPASYMGRYFSGRISPLQGEGQEFDSLTVHIFLKRKYKAMTNETKVAILTARKNLLNERDPMGNINIIRKINRLIRKYSKEKTNAGMA